MTLRDVLLPLFVDVILTFVLLFWMAYQRTTDVTDGSVATREVALPMLFYVLTILAWDTHHAGTVFVVLAWLFVLTRVILAIVHVTDNNLRRRGPVFIVGAIVLAIMWGNYILNIVVGL